MPLDAAEDAALIRFREMEPEDMSFTERWINGTEDERRARQARANDARANALSVSIGTTESIMIISAEDNHDTSDQETANDTTSPPENTTSGADNRLGSRSLA